MRVVEERVVKRADWEREEEEGVVCEATEDGRRMDCPVRECACEGVCM